MDETHKEYKQNEPGSALTHFLGFVFSVAGLILLLIHAARNGSSWHIVGFSIYGTSLVLLYLASTLYHYVPITSSAKRTMQKFDHAMIFILIAGTYTPITFLMTNRGWGWALFGTIWGLAALGILMKAAGFGMNTWYSALPYIGMGWLITVAFGQLSLVLPKIALEWIIAGGLFYTVGAGFFGLDFYFRRTRWFGMHEIWHLFVLAGSACHFWVMYRYVIPL